MHRASKLKDNFSTICAVLAGLILVGVMGSMDAADEQSELAHYCDMVKLHKNDPSTGWPDYNGIYREACKP